MSRLRPADLIPRLVACGTSLGEVEAASGGKMPATYIEMLSMIGRGAGVFLSDLTAFYPAILGLTAKRRPGLAEYGVFPDDGFVIADRYGEQIVWIRPSEGPADLYVSYLRATGFRDFRAGGVNPPSAHSRRTRGGHTPRSEDQDRPASIPQDAYG